MTLGELPALKKLSGRERWHERQSHARIPKEFFVVQCFHISPAVNRDAILQYGLKPFAQPTGTITFHPSVFISLTVEGLPWEYFGHGEIDIWTFCISPKKLTADTYGPPGTWFYTQEAVPYYKLYLHESIEDVYSWGMQTSP